MKRLMLCLVAVLSLAVVGASATVSAQDGGEIVVQQLTTEDPVDHGDLLTVDVRLYNEGDDAGESEVRVELVGGSSAEWNESLEAGDATVRQVQLGTGGVEPGVHDVEAETADDLEVESAEVEPALDLRVVDVDSSVAAGDDVDVTVEITNDGDGSHQADLELVLTSDSEHVESALEVPANTVYSGDFSVSTDAGDVGSRTLDVSYGYAGDAVDVVVEEQEDEPTPEFRLDILETNGPIVYEETEMVEAEVAVENVGDAAGEDELWFGLASKGFDLDAGERVVLDIGYEIPWGEDELEFGPGEHEVKATLLEGDGESSATVEVVEDEEDGGSDGSLRIASVDAQTPVYEGENLELEVEVENVDDVAADGVLAAGHESLDGDSTALEVGAGEKVVEDLQVATSSGDAGSYDLEVRVGGDRTTETVDVLETADGGGFRVSVDGPTDEVAAGEDVVLDLSVENAGEETASTLLAVDAGDLGGDRREVEAEAGEAVEFEVSLETGSGDVGVHDVVVRAGGHRTSESVEVVESDEPEFSVSFGQVDDSVEAGEGVDAEVVVENTGEIDGEALVDVVLGEIDRVRRQVEVDSGANVTVDVELSTDSVDSGRNEIEAEVDEDNASTEVEVEEDGSVVESIVELLRFWS